MRAIGALRLWLWPGTRSIKLSARPSGCAEWGTEFARGRQQTVEAWLMGPKLVRRIFLAAVLSVQLCCMGSPPQAGTPEGFASTGRRLQVTAGTDGTPGGSTFNRISSALMVAQPGDTLVLREGRYQESIDFPRSGEPGRPIVLMAQPGETVVLDGGKMSIPRWQGVVNILNRSHIVVEGIQVINSNQRGIVAYSRNGTASGILLRNCRVTRTADAGIVLERVRASRLESCEAGYAAGGSPGFLINQSQDIEIVGCRAHHNGLGGGGTAQGFLVYEGTRIRLQNCVAEDNVRDGFDIGGGDIGATEVSVRQCVSRRNGEDGVGINSQAREVTVQQCLLAFNGENAVNIYQGAQSIKLYNNTFVGHVHYLWIDGSDLPERPIADLEVVNCIGYGASSRAIVTVAPLGKVKFDYNCWTGEKRGYGEFCLWEMGPGEKAFGFADLGEGGRWSRLLGQGEHSFSADPRFVDPGNQNFQLTRESPCVDAGTPVGLPYLGRAPDLGAFELTQE
ncbi:MAG: hypothetical protein D6715_08115 [Calditrichaeota bacterium]|nr:MAG: hypothetical protein D6715_08115 [Calditrichota bacterium]